MAAVAAFILAPEIGIPTMPLQFKVSHQNNHSLPKIPRNSHVCVSQQEGTCLAHLCSSEQRMYFPTTHIPIFVDHASPYQFWQRQAVAGKQINMVSLLLEDYYYCLKTRLGLVGGLAIAFFPSLHSPYFMSTAGYDWPDVAAAKKERQISHPDNNTKN